MLARVGCDYCTDTICMLNKHTFAQTQRGSRHVRPRAVSTGNFFSSNSVLKGAPETTKRRQAKQHIDTKLSFNYTFMTCIALTVSTSVRGEHHRVVLFIRVVLYLFRHTKYVCSSFTRAYILWTIQFSGPQTQYCVGFVETTTIGEMSERVAAMTIEHLVWGYVDKWDTCNRNDPTRRDISAKHPEMRHLEFRDTRLKIVSEVYVWLSETRCKHRNCIEYDGMSSAMWSD